MSGKWVVKGQTDNFLLYISIALFLILKFFEIYSVMPKYFLFKKVFLFIGPLINLLILFFLIILNASWKQLSMYLLDFDYAHQPFGDDYKEEELSCFCIFSVTSVVINCLSKQSV